MASDKPLFPKDHYCPHCLRGWNDEDVDMNAEFATCPHCEEAEAE